MIDRATVERIKDTANIVDVVSEFVTLRKSGANYKGLCPFHNEKTPSFIVSPARGTCHCFGCGKGGNAIGFIMEHEQMNYPEALRWLARKYHIEIREREMTDEERREQSERESMFIVNEWAAGYFSDLLHNHPDGQAIGMQYFRSRGFRDDIIRKFQLGYDLPDRTLLSRTAIGKGYQEEFLLKTGICYKTDRGDLIDRYSGRVIFPWIGLNGKVVGFGGRVLDSRTKGVNQKYVNSPASEIYQKDRELYGIYQAKKAIAKEDWVYMVEGYTDVISMHQCGVENVVANSGTALSMHQIHILHRFTSNITLLYDGDAAGIHAAFRGMDMLLSEGMNVKILLLPDGDDPDSFARKHSADDFKAYIDKHQVDFIQFKTDMMVSNVIDPFKRSEGINSIISSIAVVPNQILRDTYVQDCARRIGMSEQTLINTMNRYIRENRGARTTEQQRAAMQAAQSAPVSHPTPSAKPMAQASKVELMLIQLVIRKGEQLIYEGVEDDNHNVVNFTVAQYIDYILNGDQLQLGNELYRRILSEAVSHSGEEGFVAEQYFVHHDDIEISKLASKLSMDAYQVMETQKPASETKYIDEEQLAREAQEALRNHTIHLVMDYRMDYVEQRLKDLMREIAEASNDAERMQQLMLEYKDMHQIRNALAKQLGNNIIV
ncbi:DNA primase [Prevotella sp. BV3P1]|uniref:DNA primase n=1 Tax=Hoylesella buccalis DNF00853 TaxID=1401074 RepID=A0A095ZFB0_9BACT|nr:MULTISPECIES: DNA primase [Prevotellaceae]ERT59823.1 DNA primase [Prevotella sp. BV3P1]KGF33076.1 DNA primase [Hoylesella buccalis DNF00853]KGF40497.1 DNA primase [Hoylesella buccalis DNF00985]